VKEHEENTLVKNINYVEIGRYRIETWYFSPYPPEFCPAGTVVDTVRAPPPLPPPPPHLRYCRCVTCAAAAALYLRVLLAFFPASQRADPALRQVLHGDVLPAGQ
jgi:MYST family zinc finger domain